MKNFFLFQIWAIALNVWRESVRDRLVHLMAGSGVTMMVLSLVLGEMAVGGRDRVIQNTGFWTLGLWGLLTVIYLGSGIVKRELQRKTVYLILSRPVNRSTFLMGKFFGMILVLFSVFCLLAISWLLIMKLTSVPVRRMHVWALAFIFGEWVLLSALSIFFASFTSPLLHNFFLIGASFLGHWSNDLKIFSENAEEVSLKYFLKTIYYILPNLEALNFREAALYNTSIPLALLGEGAIVLAGWVALALAAGNMIFTRRRLL